MLKEKKRITSFNIFSSKTRFLLQKTQNCNLFLKLYIYSIQALTFNLPLNKPRCGLFKSDLQASSSSSLSEVPHFFVQFSPPFVQSFLIHTSFYLNCNVISFIPFQVLIPQVIHQANLKSIPEIASLGILHLIDSSHAIE